MIDPFQTLDPYASLDRRLGMMPGPRQSQLASLDQVSPDDESLLEKLAASGGSALDWIGRTLDKTFGGATVRSLLGGDGLSSLAHLIPFSDSLGLTDKNGILGSDLLASRSDVPSGRQLLENADILDKKQPSDGFDLGDLAGIATEIVTDPAAWLSGGTTALAKSAGGELATKALGEEGLLNALTRRSGSTLTQGWREGAIKNTLSDVLDRVPSAAGKLEAAAGGKDALQGLLASSEPLGGLARVHLPLMPSAGFNVGTGETGAKLASYLDQLGEGIRYSGPGRLAASLFSHPSGEMLSKEGQLSKQATTAAEGSAIADATGELLPHIRAFEDAGWAGPEHSRDLRDVFEGKAEAPPELQPHVEAIQAIKEGMKQKYNDLGLDMNEWESKWQDLLYHPRQSGLSGERVFKGTRAFKTGDQFGIGRIGEFDVPGGTNMLNDMSVDPFISGPNRGAAAISVDAHPAVVNAEKAYVAAQNNLAQGLTDQASVVQAKQNVLNARANATRDIAGQHIVGKYFGVDPANWEAAQKELAGAKRQLSDARTGLEPNADAIQAASDRLTAAQAIHDPMAESVKQSKGLADILKDRDAAKVAAGEVMFPNSPLADMMTRTKAAARTTQAAQGVYDFLGNYAVKDGTDLDSVPVRDLLDKMELKYNTKPLSSDVLKAAQETGMPIDPTPQYTGAIQSMAKKLGVTPDKVLDYRVPKDIAGDATRMIKTFQSPDAVKAVLNGYDKFTSWFKTWVTTPFPGFHFRNKMTGMVSDLIGGLAAKDIPINHIEATKLLAGETIAGLAKRVPVFAGMTDEEATKQLANLAAQHGLYRGGQIAKDIAPETQSVANMIPGVVPTTLGTAFKASLPDVVNGIESQAGLWGKVKSFLPHPAQAGLQLGNIGEDGNRIASFLGFLKNGWDDAAAAAKTKAMHGDYAALSQFEKGVMKRLVPFYSFTRLVVPTFIKDLLQNPGGLTAQAVRTENDLRQQSGFVPDQVGQGLAVPLGESAPGTQKFLTESGVVPIENLNDLIRPGVNPLDSIRKTGSALLGQMNPLIKGTLESLTGQQFYSGRDLADLQGRLPGGTLVNQIAMNSPLSRVISSAGKLADDRKGPIEKLLNTMTGLRTSDVNVSKARDVAARQSIESLMRGTDGARLYQSLTVTPDALATMSPDELKLYQLYKGIGKRAADRARERKAAVPVQQ